MYMILNPSVQTHISIDEFSGKNKISNMTEYSSDSVRKIPKDEIEKNNSQFRITGLSN